MKRLKFRITVVALFLCFSFLGGGVTAHCPLPCGILETGCTMSARVDDNTNIVHCPSQTWDVNCCYYPEDDPDPGLE